MNTEEHEEIQTAFLNATNAVRNLETVIRKHHSTPKSNINIGEFIKIKMPTNYIRTTDFFRAEYNLNSLFGDRHQISNTAYALMQSDFHNYLVSRLEMFSVVKYLFFKTAIINLVAIQEALIICSLDKLHTNCKFDSGICKYNSKCSHYSKSTKSERGYNGCIDLFERTVGFGANFDFVSELKRLNSIRNYIHISLVKESELSMEKYSLENYNAAIKALLFLKANLLVRINLFKEEQNRICHYK